MTVTVLLQASPELLDCLNGLTAALAGTPGVEKIRSIKVRPEDGQPNEPLPLPAVEPAAPKARKAAKISVPAAEETPPVPTAYESSEGTPAITVEVLRALGKRKKDEGKAIKPLLLEFETDSISALAAEHYADFHAKLLAL